MDGVVSLLDAQHEQKVHELWAEFKANFGVHGVHMTPVPHFSYHVAENYDIDRLDRLLRKIVRETRPFDVKTNGLALFTGADPVLYIPVVRNPALTNFHLKMWHAISESAFGTVDYYHPDNWRPHITLTHRDVNHDLLPHIIRLLSERQFFWNIHVDNLSLLHTADDNTSIRLHFPLGQ